MLHYFIKSYVNKIKSRSGFNLHVESSSFSGIRTVHFTNITLAPSDTIFSDTLLSVKSIVVTLDLAHLFLLQPRFTDLAADSLLINAVRYDSITDNYSSLFRKGDSEISNSHSQYDYSIQLEKMLRKLRVLLSGNVTLNYFRCNYRHSDKTEFISVPELFIDNGVIKASLITASADGVTSYLIHGNANPADDNPSFPVECPPVLLHSLQYLFLHSTLPPAFL